MIVFILLSRVAILRDAHTYSYWFKETSFIEEYEKAALCIKEDAQAVKDRIKIMSRKSLFAYLAGGESIAFPYKAGWGDVVSFAQRKGVDYIAVDKQRYIGRTTPALFYLTPVNENLKLIYENKTVLS